MNFTDIFIRRPVLAVVISLVIIIAGLQAIKTVNVRQYPRSENSTVTVTTVYVGASAELVRGFITTPLERAIAAADGAKRSAHSSPSALPKMVAPLASV
ncbi:MAG: efflux RND transporter permease subunit, partial [Proteobacteria bacterium]|nr:efflux RND transporter permease subunit [Pseudomonadota bacterium]